MQVPHISNHVTVVCGLPRSGTSMMMRMLEAGGLPALTDHVRQPNADNPSGYYEFEPVKKTKQDPSWVAQATGKAVKMVYRLVYDLPLGYEYRLLFMRRDLNEVLASQRVMLDREKLVDEVEDRTMAALFRSELARFERWLKQQPNMSCLNVDHREVIHDTTSAVAKIIDFLDTRLESDAMCRIVDRNLYRNRLGDSVQQSH